MKKYFDEFVKLPLAKMAQKITDMTYEYKGTIVPKKHYQDILNEEILAMLAQNSTMELVLLNAVVSQLESLEKESPKLFFKALVIMDKKIKMANMDSRIFDSLQETYELHQKSKTLLKDEIIDTYDNLFNEHPDTLDDETQIKGFMS